MTVFLGVLQTAVDIVVLAEHHAPLHAIHAVAHVVVHADHAAIMIAAASEFLEVRFPIVDVVIGLLTILACQPIIKVV